MTELDQENPAPTKKTYVFPSMPTDEQKAAFIVGYVNYNNEGEYFKSAVKDAKRREEGAKLLLDFCLSEKGLKESYDAIGDFRKRELMADAALYLDFLSTKSNSDKDRDNRKFHHDVVDFLAKKWVEYRDEQRDLSEEMKPHVEALSALKQARANGASGKFKRPDEIIVFDNRLMHRPEAAFCRELLGAMNEGLLTSVSLSAAKDLKLSSKGTADFIDELECTRKSVVFETLNTAMGAYNFGIQSFSSYLPIYKSAIRQDIADAMLQNRGSGKQKFNNRSTPFSSLADNVQPNKKVDAEEMITGAMGAGSQYALSEVRRSNYRQWDRLTQHAERILKPRERLVLDELFDVNLSASSPPESFSDGDCQQEGVCAEGNGKPTSRKVLADKMDLSPPMVGKIKEGAISKLRSNTELQLALGREGRGI